MSWTVRRLGEVTDNFDAVRVPVRAADRQPGPYPYYGASGVIDWIDEFVLDGEFLLVAEDGENLRTRKTPIAFVANGRFWVNNHAHVIRGNGEADTRFLSYYLSVADISGYLSGSTQPKLTQASLGRIPVRLPPIDEQRAIAGVLGALDDKIELNRRMNETLAQLAVEHFRREYWQSPDQEAWAEERLGSHLDVVRGLSYTGAGLTAHGLALHNLNSIHEGGGYKRAGLKWYSGEYKERHVIQAKDIIVANTEQGFEHLLIGFPAIVPAPFGETGLFSHHLYRVRPKEASPLTPALVYLLLLAGPLRAEIAGYANGTTVNMLPQDALQKPVFRVPPSELAQKLDGLVQPLFARAEAAERESETLAGLRDTLLPKLISGELRVRDTEVAIEERRSASRQGDRGQAPPS